MTHQQLGLDAAARLGLAYARRVLDPVTQKGSDKHENQLGFWMEWVEAQNLVREATALIEGQTNASAVDVKARAN